MIRSMEHMRKFEIVATDGRIGAVDDFYFDDERWAIRYVVVDTGRWMPGRRVLISPLSISHSPVVLKSGLATKAARITHSS